MFYIYIYIAYFLSRGPNKYTRNWEDEDAYGKTIPGRGNNRRFNKNNEDFPALGNSKVNAVQYILIISHFVEYYFSFLLIDTEYFEQGGGTCNFVGLVQQ